MTVPLGLGRLRGAAANPATADHATGVRLGDLAPRVGPRPSAPLGSDQLALVRAAIGAGHFAQALELLDAVWSGDSAGEHAWYLRLWIVLGQGRIAEALDLSRIAAGLLPDSAAVAYLHAILERAQGGAAGALEAALHSMAAAPDHPLPEALLTALLEPGIERGTLSEIAPAPVESRADPVIIPGQNPVLNPLAAVLVGEVLLQPAWSAGAGAAAELSATPTQNPILADGDSDGLRDARWRFALLAVGTIAAALWAVRAPLPAAALLAGLAAWLTRPRRGRGRPAA